MVRKLTAVIAASAAALSFLAAPVGAKDVPSSVNESGFVGSHHDRATVQRPIGRAGQAAGAGELRGTHSSGYAVQTPSSVNESAPWLAGGQRSPTSQATY